VRVVANKFPVLGIEGDLNRQGEGMYDKMNGIGAHEVIIETPDHLATLAEMPERQIEEMLWAFREPGQRSEERPEVPLHPAVQELRRGGRGIAGASAFPTHRAAGDFPSGSRKRWTPPNNSTI